MLIISRALCAEVKETYTVVPMPVAFVLANPADSPVIMQ
jgi:hypothetical protein